MRLSTFFILFLFLAINSWSQNFVFEKITTREGLSQNDVNDIYQDKNGFLWVGTNDGLNRFDGYNFKTYRANPKEEGGISSDLVFDIAEDADGNLWLGTSDAGVCKFDVKTEKFTVFKNTKEIPDFLITNQIVRILPTRNGDIWLATPVGLNVLHSRNGSYVAEKIEIPSAGANITPGINALVEDVYGRIWVGSKSGIHIFSDKKEPIHLKTSNTSSFIKEIFFTDEEVFVAYTNGIFRHKIDWETLKISDSKKISDLNVDCLLVNKHGDVFCGNHRGLTIISRHDMNTDGIPNSNHFTEGWESNSLSKNVVKCLFEDGSGIIWIGTNGGGLNKYNPKQKAFRHFNKTRIKGSLSYNKIRTIYQDSEENIWVGTEGGGMNFLSNTSNKNFESGWKSIDVNPKGSAYIYAMLERKNRVSGKNEFWVGTGYPQVIARMDIKNNKPVLIRDAKIFSEVTNSPFTFEQTDDGTIWTGTYGRTNGLLRFTETKDGMKMTNFLPNQYEGSISAANIRSLLQDNYGNLWIGTDVGLNLLTPEEQKKDQPVFRVFKKNKDVEGSISHDYILPIFQSKDGTIWVGTMGGGLNELIYSTNYSDIKFKSITTDDGLPNNVIKGILEDDYGFLWISSNKGLTRYDVKDKVFKNFGISDGLQDYEFGELACCKLKDGEMLFGGVNGITAFYPKDIIEDKTLPRIALTDFQILNRSVAPGEKLNGRVVLPNAINHTNKVRLKYAENSFAIYFSSIHFSAPEKNTYKYKLEGFDNEWVRKDASDRIAKYTNLRPGRYVFKVLASNNDGIWADDAKVLEIIITPPWYLSIVAWVLYVLVFLVSLWFFQKFSLIRIKQKNELLMEHFEKEKAKELSQMKLRFFTNISHEFRTPLTLIIGPLEKLIHRGNTLSEKKIAETYSIMHRNASILLRLINQLIDFRKFEQGKMILRASNSNIIAFLNEVFLSFTELANNKNIDYSFSSPRDDIPVWFDDDKLERIMYNLLSNAFKFTPEGGKINVLVDEDDTSIIVKVVDTGVGIPKEMQKNIFERFYQTERIKNRKVGSTGIGLSFIKGLVEMHGGDISFESEEDLGTTFFVKLKKGNAHLNDEQMRAVSREANTSRKNYSFLEPVKVEREENGAESKKKKTKVLIVEDNFELRSFVKDSLNDVYDIYMAENGKEGLDKVAELNPEVVVSDIMMPVMNGFELCETIKSDEKISHIPVILLTAKSTAENRIIGYKKGADGYISKPFSLEVLEARIQNLIESREKLRNTFKSNIVVEPSKVTTTSMDEKFLQRILKIIEENIPNSEFTVEQLSTEYGMSQIVMNKKLKSLTGYTAKAFIRSIRLKRAAQLFATGKYSVTDVTYEVGFSDLKYFRTCFKDQFALSPSEYMKKHKENGQK